MIENGAVPKMAQLRVFFILSWTHEPCVPTVCGRKLLFTDEGSLYSLHRLSPTCKRELRRKLLRNYSHSIVAGGFDEMS